MGMTIEPNYFVEVFRCCEDCKMHESCVNVGHGCCSYKLYKKGGRRWNELKMERSF